MQKHSIVLNRADWCALNFAEGMLEFGHNVSFDTNAAYTSFDGELCKRDSEAALKLKRLWDNHFKHGI